MADNYDMVFGKPITNWKNTIRNVLPHLKHAAKRKKQNKHSTVKGIFGKIGGRKCYKPKNQN